MSDPEPTKPAPADRLADAAPAGAAPTSAAPADAAPTGAVPVGKEAVPLDVQVHNESQSVVVKWADGHTSSYSISRLRGYCPCAACRGHSGGELTYIDNQVSAIFDVVLVGRYAVNFKFADAHSTGLFRWDVLRRLDPTEVSRWGAPEGIGRA